MSSANLKLKAQKREISGKKVALLRREGKVPAVIYERGQQSVNVMADLVQLTKIWHAAGGNHVVTLDVEGSAKMVMFKDVDLDPVKGTLSHVAFHAIKQNEAVEAEVPVQLDGLAPATVKGLFVRQNVDTIAVKGLPGDLPDSIIVDVTGIEGEDDDIRLSQLKIDSKLTVELDPETVIVSVTVPRSEVEQEAEESADAANVPSDNGGAAPSEQA